MKIILANKFFYPRGGDCIHTIGLKQLLESKGHEVAIFSMQYPENFQNEYCEYWPSTLDFSKQKPGSLKEALFRPIYSGEVKKKWLKLLEDFKPDIIHLHNIHTQISPLIAQLSKRKGIPVFWTLHDYKLLCPASAFLDSNNEVCTECLLNKKAVKLKRCIKGSRIGSYIGYLEAKKWNSYKLQNYVNYFISPSEFLKLKMIEGGYAQNKIIHLSNFANNYKFHEQVITKRNNKIIYVGRVSVEKGVSTLCKAVFGDPNLKLQIVGDGPLRKSLEKEFNSSNIEFLGFQPWNVIKENLAKAAFLVLPSQWFENNPLTIIEAFSLGTPVLGANIGGIPDMIQKNVNGMIFNSGDEGDLKHQIQEMLDFSIWDYKKIQNIAKEKYSEDIFYNKLLAIYNNVITDAIN